MLIGPVLSRPRMGTVGKRGAHVEGRRREAQAPADVHLPDAQDIDTAERARELGLDRHIWPAREQTLPGWTSLPIGFRRSIRTKKDDAPVPLEETILRFPSAP